MTAESTLLRRAAETLREAAEAATRGRWAVAAVDGQGFAVHHGEHDTVALYCARPDATYIAMNDPVVGAKLADLLDRIAWLDDNGDSVSGLLRDHVDAVARSILHETGGE